MLLLGKKKKKENPMAEFDPESSFQKQFVECGFMKL